MWTGVHAKETGLWDNTNFAWISELSSEVPTIGHLLRDQGYYTAFKGKWHLSEVPRSEDGLERYGFADYQQWGEMFGAPLTEMAKHFKVIAIHARGHGFSKDTNAPWSLAQAADDVAAVLKQLKINKASVMGYSFGAAIAVQFAIRHPDMLDRLVVVSVAYARAGEYPEMQAAFEQMPAMADTIGGEIAKSPLAKTYPGVDWPTLMRKTGELNRQDYDWSAGIRGIKARTLLVFADADAIRPEHIAQFYKLLGGGQRDAGFDGSLRSPNELAIVPGTTHYNLMRSPFVIQFATAFLQQVSGP